MRLCTRFINCAISIEINVVPETRVLILPRYSTLTYDDVDMESENFKNMIDGQNKRLTPPERIQLR